MRRDAAFVMVAPIPAVLILGIVARPVVWGPSHVVGLVLLGVGLALMTVARWQLGDSFSIEAKATALVTRGLYARVRNPVYTFGLVMLAGLVLYVGQPWLLLVLVPIAWVQVVRARAEARVLEERFGDTYRAYRQGTWF